MILRKHHSIYGYGQLFAFSGIDGDTAGARDFCATFLDDPVTLRFETDPPVSLRIPLGDGAVFDAIGGDFLEGRDAAGSHIFVAFEDARTVVGLSPVKPMLSFSTFHQETANLRFQPRGSHGVLPPALRATPLSEGGETGNMPPSERGDAPKGQGGVHRAQEKHRGYVLQEGEDGRYAPCHLVSAPSPDGWLFRLAFKETATPLRTPRENTSCNGEGTVITPTSRTPREDFLSPPLSAVESVLRARREWLESQPACPTPGFDGLWAKCLAIEKENTLSPEGVFSCRWTTPDRVPHRDAWLWDSAFHAMAMSGSDPALARDALRAVLVRQRDDGFIPHHMAPDGQDSSITQPQVLAWAALFLHKRASDTDFLAWAAPRLQAFLDWTVRNRDRNGNGLLEWHTGSDPHCRCDESGLDNSPRFDFDDPAIDAIDFSCYLAHDAGCLAEIWRILGRDAEANAADALRDRTAERINALLWSETDGLYYDRLADGSLSGVASVASFLPLWAGICPPDRAARLVAALTDPARFWTALPVPSIARNSPQYDTDMWRGCSWLNLDWFLWLGLRRYGYAAEAEELRRRVLAAVNKWYLRHGTLFEFYDADDRLSPFELKRKGPPVMPPDWRRHMHSITDYHWSAAFTRLFLESAG